MTQINRVAGEVNYQCGGQQITLRELRCCAVARFKAIVESREISNALFGWLGISADEPPSQSAEHY